MLSALERGYQPVAAVVPEPYRILNVCIASPGVMYFHVQIPRKAAHAARGYKGSTPSINAIDKVVRVCDTIELDREWKARISYERVIRRTPEAVGEVTNLNFGNIRGGDLPSTVPEAVTIEGRIGCRRPLALSSFF